MDMSLGKLWEMVKGMEAWRAGPWGQEELDMTGWVNNNNKGLDNPKENQPWIFNGRTDAEAEAPILQLPDGKGWLIRKDPDAGKDWRLEEKGMTEDEMVG